MSFVKKRKNRTTLNFASVLKTGYFKIILLVIVLTILGYFLLTPNNKSAGNRLLVGQAYKGLSPYKINLVTADSSTVDLITQIEQIRIQQVTQHAEKLLSGPYKPFNILYNGIDPDLEWISLGQLYYQGTEEADVTFSGKLAQPAAFNHILNPFLLVEPHFWGLSIWGPAKLKWNKSLATVQQISQNYIPLVPKASELIYYPEEARAEVTYNVRMFIDRVNPYLLTPLTSLDTAFAISLQNARDFGYNFYYLDLGLSEGIANAKQPGQASENLDHFGSVMKSWGRNPKTNHLSANNPLYDWISVTGLPAKAIVKLWLNSPNEITEPADFTYTINLY